MYESIDLTHMRRALLLAQKAADLGEVPVGALIVHNSQVISEAYNFRENSKVATQHAELVALESACKALGRWRLSGCTLYVTLEPCLMCAGAIILSRVDRVVYGATDPKAGAVRSLYQVLEDNRLNHRPEVTAGILADECSSILSEFFKKRRTKS